MSDADIFHRQMVDVREWADRHSSVSLSILSDLDGLVLHTAEIAERVAATVDEIRFLRREKYALVVPSYLMRMQCRRLLQGIEYQVFDSRELAMDWLGWSALSRVRAA
ncbi:hypothetical protein [Sphingomonas sp. G-3-2-10]|uniref:hypothetical protein n=1 Tax=Sphingomonas sp. G-3-2-10 TaxID=2728838 RepID=UPI00146C8145|nr:hypothetical protein [Sphingomonas sp. G-3-2-10]NML06048.1 hypothetical protein [Sphingomonas sp. G-3-2-10]